MDNDQAMQFGDIVKVVIPLLIIVFAFFTWIVAIIGLCVACCCAPVEDESFEMLTPPPAPRLQPRPVMPRPAPQPVMPSYPVYPSYYGYGYPYYGAYANYGYGAGGGAGSQYGGAASVQGYSGLANALLPYTGRYGGATYGGYGTRAIAQNPYI